MEQRPAIVIPAYRPAARLVSLVRSLQADGYPRIAVVDDGSGPAHRAVFERLERLPGVDVIPHLVNRGKGEALKTGLNHLFARDPDLVGAVTVDSDGQHLPEDVRKVAAALIEHPDRLCLGSRSFDGAVPWKSRIGNSLSRLVLWILSGHLLRDTQTGLRGIPRELAATLLTIHASRYDFEQEMIIRASRQGRRLLQVPIQTVYRDDNRGSHFDPLWDSLRVYGVFFRVLLASLQTSLFDFAVFATATLFGASLLPSFLAGRALSSLPDLLTGRRRPAQVVGGAPLALLRMAIAFGITLALVERFQQNVYLAKLAAEALVLLVRFGWRRGRSIVRRDDDELWDASGPGGAATPRAGALGAQSDPGARGGP